MNNVIYNRSGMLLLVCFLTLGYFGESQEMLTDDDPKAVSLLNKVADKIQSYDNLMFTYKGNLKNTESRLDMDVNGKAVLKGDKYNVDFMGSTYLYNGSNLYIINREDQQVTITSPDSGDQANLITPSNMLTFYDKGYSKSWDIKQNVNGRMVQYVRLKPRDNNSEYKNVLLGIDVNTNHIYNAIITEQSGTKVTFTLTSLKTDMPLPGSTFEFNRSQYSGWDIENMN